MKAERLTARDGNGNLYGYIEIGIIANSDWYLLPDGRIRQIGDNTQGDTWDRVYPAGDTILDCHKQTGIMETIDEFDEKTLFL